MTENNLTYDDIAELFVSLNTNPVNILRSSALASYASLEANLASLFAALLEVPPKIADVVFWKILNTRSRCDMLTDLMKIRFQKKYEKWWSSMLKDIRGIDQGRNKVAHWRATDFHDSRLNTKQTVLMNPSKNFLFEPEKGMSERDLARLIRRTNFASSDVIEFAFYIQGLLSLPPDKFLKPRVYPSLETHPVPRN